MNKPDSKRVFTFESYDFNPKSKEIHFNYRLSGKGEDIAFQEKLIFPKNLSWRNAPDKVLHSALESLHIILGISYWKLYCPKKIVLNTTFLSKEQANFFNRVYTLGLGEFFYKNKIDFRNLIKFPSSSKLKTKNYQLKTNKSRALLLFGGGKDSYVSAEILKKDKKNFDYFTVITGGREVLQNLAPKGTLTIERFLDPKLFELNKSGKVYRGHIPVSAILASIGELAAILYDYRYVIASNEKSANYGNVKYLGREINHQWSKSIEFEEMMQNYSHRYITPSVTYFSLLRPLYEIKIVEIFTRFGKKYFNKFSSCNTNFKIGERAPKRRWCLNCPKCAFVFTMMAPFISKKKLIDIFGGNAFNKKNLLNIFKELLGIRAIKPFECVGTPDEMRLAMSMILIREEFKNDFIIKKLGSKIKHPSKKVEKEIMGLSGDHMIPKEFKKAIPIYE